MKNISWYRSRLKDELFFLKRYLFNIDIKDIILLPLIYDYIYFLRKNGADHPKINNKINNISKVNLKIGIFCTAEVKFLKGDFVASIRDLLKIKENFSGNEEIFYLLYKNYIMLEDSLNANRILYDLIEFSKRKKTWMYLANNIKSLEDFLLFENKIFYNFNEKYFLKDVNLVNYYSEAAIRAGEYQKATNIWMSVIKNNNVKTKKNLKKKFFNSNNAKEALLNLRSILVKSNIEFFLVSGTLLGCVRDNKILPHDKDLDIGIYDTNIKNIDLKKIIFSSGFFEILPTRTEKQIKLKHVNGTYIDVFIHQIDNNLCWHYTSKIKWFNRPFNLINYNFFGKNFLIPDNIEIYLTENYGNNWRVPQIDFDSNFDTPNAVVINEDEMQVFYVRMLAYKYLGNDLSSPSFNRLVENLSNEVKLCLKKELISQK